MKVLIINGSPHAKGNTYAALSMVAEELEQGGVETEWLHIGHLTIRGCMACNHCRNHDHRCIYKDDLVNDTIEKARSIDGFLFGSPTYYAGINGTLAAFMDRFFYTSHGYCAYKPGAAVLSAHRSGTTNAYDQINKYIGMNKMLMVPSPYWNMVLGHTLDEILADERGVSTMHHLGKNMVWLLKVLESAKKNNLPLPE